MSDTHAAAHGKSFALDVPLGYEGGDRLDVYLAELVPEVSRTKVQRGIKRGLVQVNGQVVKKKAYAVEAGDRIEGQVPLPPPVKAEPEPIPLDVVYEDAELLVVNKPAGMVVHPAYGHRTGTLVNALLYHVGGSALYVEEVGEEEFEDEEVGLSTVNAVPRRKGDPAVRPGIVHRLDKDTTGLLVVAKSDDAHVKLARQFQQHTVSRRYRALVWGTPDPPSGRVQAPIGRDPQDRKKMAVVPEGEGKQAVTHYDTVEPLGHTALVQFELETGRTHQIRVHAQHLHHPVLGDPTYGGQAIRYGTAGGKRRTFFHHLFEEMPRQALHAHTLGFIHPGTGERVHFEVGLPADMQHVLDRIREVEGA